MTIPETERLASRLYGMRANGPSGLVAEIEKEFTAHVLNAQDITVDEFMAVLHGDVRDLGAGYYKIQRLFRNSALINSPTVPEKLQEWRKRADESNSVILAQGDVIQDETISDAFQALRNFFYRQIGARNGVEIHEIQNDESDSPEFRVFGLNHDGQQLPSFTFVPDRVIYHDGTDGFSVIGGQFRPDVLYQFRDSGLHVVNMVKYMASMTGPISIASDMPGNAGNSHDMQKVRSLHVKSYDDMGLTVWIGAPANPMLSMHGAFVIRCQDEYQSPQDPVKIEACWFSRQAVRFSLEREAFFMYRPEDGFTK